MLAAMARMGVKVEKHHHEVAFGPARLGMKFSPLTVMADQLQIYKILHFSRSRRFTAKSACFPCRSRFTATTLGRCHASVNLEGAASRFSPAINIRPSEDLPVS